MTDSAKRRRLWRWLAAVCLGVLSAAGGCSDDGDDLAPTESEAGEEDTEIVPGEEGPVD